MTNLKDDPNIETIEQDYVVESLGDVEEETIPWGVNEVSSTIAHQEGIKGKGVKVAVFDTGINEHPDLNINGGVSFVDGTDSFRDDNGHGTHVAGIMASLINDQGIIGVAPSVELYSVKVLDSAGNGRYSSIIQAVDWAIENKINLINMSFGGSEKSKILEDTLQLAYENNILIFAAAGNGGKISDDTILYPAKYKQVVAVGAIDKNEERAEFSSIGSELELVAPGVDIESTLSDGLYGNKSGTSMAAPHATGVAALLWSKDINLPNQAIRDLLSQSAVGLGDKDLYGNGLVNARYAMDFYNDFAEVKNGKKDKVTKIKKQKYPESNNVPKPVDPIVTAAGVVETYYLDSPHPYSNNYYNTWTISKSGATNIRVHFSSIQLEANYDWVTARTAGNVEISSWTGSNSDTWSSWSGSSSIIIALSSDGSITNDGFKIDRIEYNMPADDYGNSFGSANLIQVGAYYSGNINYVSDVDFFKFTPIVSGDHVIASSEFTDVLGTLYNSSQTQLAENDDYGGTKNFRISYNLTAGQTYYIRVKYWNNSSTGAYGLKVTPPVNDDHGNTGETATRINYNSTKSGNINYAGDIDFFVFTPTVSKSYVFKSTGSTDTYGYLYKDSYEYLLENDDYNTLNFTISQYLEVGHTYYLKVRHFSPTSTGTYSVIVNDAILGDESYKRQFLNAPLLGNREAFNRIISDVNVYSNQLDDFGSDNVSGFNSLVSTVVQRIGEVEDKVMHFSRNKLNRTPSSLNAMVQYINNNPDKKWRLLPIDESVYHMNGNGGEYNLKFISNDGNFEAIYNSISGIKVNDSQNMGTYNYVGPGEFFDDVDHIEYDVVPFYMWGNTQDQNLNRSVPVGFDEENTKAEANKAKYYNNPDAQKKYNDYYDLIPR